MTTPIVPSITDEQLAELERSVNNDLSNAQFQGEGRAVVAGIAAVIARLRAAEKNAARYMWLRDRVGVDFAYGDFMAYLPTGGYHRDEQDKKQTDEAIDVALERQL